MKIEDLLSLSTGMRIHAAQPAMDPLIEEDALREAQLLDIRFDAVRSIVGLLFELRTALQLRDGNTGVLVARQVRELSWTGCERDTTHTAWTVDGSLVRNEDDLFGITLGLWPAPGGEFRLSAESAAFFVGDVADLPEAPPDYQDDDAVIRAGIPHWRSPFTPIQAVFLDPAH